MVSLQFQREGLTKAEIIRKLDTCSLQQETTAKHKRWLVVGEKGGVQLVGCSLTSKTFITYRGNFLVSHGYDMVNEGSCSMQISSELSCCHGQLCENPVTRPGTCIKNQLDQAMMEAKLALKICASLGQAVPFYFFIEQK